MFLILCDNWKMLFFIKDYRYCEGFSNRYIAVLFERSVLKKVRILRYLLGEIFAIFAIFGQIH